MYMCIEDDQVARNHLVGVVCSLINSLASPGLQTMCEATVISFVTRYVYTCVHVTVVRQPRAHRQVSIELVA